MQGGAVDPHADAGYPGTVNTLSDILYPVVEEAQSTIDSARGLEKHPETVLFGEGGLDSLGLVRFIVLVEERLQDVAHRSLTLASEKAMSQKRSPFRTLGTLAEYIDVCLAEEGDGG